MPSSSSQFDPLRYLKPYALAALTVLPWGIAYSFLTNPAKTSAWVQGACLLGAVVTGSVVWTLVARAGRRGVERFGPGQTPFGEEPLQGPESRDGALVDLDGQSVERIHPGSVVLITMEGGVLSSLAQSDVSSRDSDLQLVRFRLG